MNSREQRRKRKKMRRTWRNICILAAVSVIVLLLYIFVFTKNTAPNIELLPSPSSTSGVISAVTMAPSPSPSQTLTQTMAPSPTQATTWGAKFPGKFTDGKVEKTSNSYKSANINVNLQKIQKDGVTYFVADIYLTDLKFFRTAFANNKYGPGNHQFVDAMANDNNAVIAIDGDYYSANPGPVIRNGKLYRDETYRDVLVLYNDGSMETFLKGQFNMKDAQSKGVYQAWTFGPQLLQDGQPMTKFNSTVTVANPRTAVGYYEPGHYCFVTVDGRQSGYSTGYTMTQLSQLFYDLGCKVAFNLDGGGSAAMAFMGNIANKPCSNYRKVDDILYITDTP